MADGRVTVPDGSQHPLHDPILLSFSLEQDEELLKSIQATIVRVEGDCEQLSYVTGSLQDDHRQHQKDIEVGVLSPHRVRLSPRHTRAGDCQRSDPLPTCS